MLAGVLHALNHKVSIVFVRYLWKDLMSNSVIGMKSQGSLELIALGLLAALVCTMAVPMLSVLF